MTGDGHNNHIGKVEKSIAETNLKSICPRHLNFFELHTNDPKLPLKFQAKEIIISFDILKVTKTT